MTAVVASCTKQQKNVPPKQLTTKLKNKEKVQSQNKPEDNRLLVRVSPDHPARSLSLYAIMLQLNTFLKEKLVKEKKIKITGFATCSVSIDMQDKLAAQMSKIEASLSSTGHYKVEKPGQYVVRRLSSVPRTYAEYDGVTAELKEITTEVIAEALTDLTNVPPIKFLESKGPENIDYSAKENWIILYPAGPNFSKILLLFGVRIAAKSLPQRFRT